MFFAFITFANECVTNKSLAKVTLINKQSLCMRYGVVTF